MYVNEKLRKTSAFSAINKNHILNIRIQIIHTHIYCKK